MTEKQKMVEGQFYDPSDPVLTTDRLAARQILHQMNILPPEQRPQINHLFQKLVKADGECFVEPPFRCDYGYNIYVGNQFYANFGCVILDICPVIIGENVMFGPGVHVYAATHPLEAALRNSGLEFGKPVNIGKNVWVGGGSIICPGVSIGEGAVIGAGSVVTKDIPSGAVVAGNPCRVIRMIGESL